MSTPKYVAKRVGDDYKLVRQDAQECAVCYASTLGGAFLAWMGLGRRTLPGLFVAGIGGGLIYRGVTGKNPLERFFGAASTFSAEDSPSFQHDAQTATEQSPEDEVDEASMESFPASDPPSSKMTTA